MRGSAPSSEPAPLAREVQVRAADAKPPLVIGCGALAVELVELTRRAGLPAVDLTCLPASLHNRPERIPAAVRARIRRARADGYDRLFVAYADCGTGGLLDRMLEEEGVARLEGAHCYEVYAGRAAFAGLADEEPGTFYLTDFLVRNFDRLVIRGLGLDRHPELLPIYFGNYRRLVFLAQTEDSALDLAAEVAANRLGLSYERRFTGLGELAGAVVTFAGSGRAAAPTTAHGALRYSGYEGDASFRRLMGPEASHVAHSMRSTHETSAVGVPPPGPSRLEGSSEPFRPEVMRPGHEGPAKPPSNRRRVAAPRRVAARAAAARATEASAA